MTMNQRSLARGLAVASLLLLPLAACGRKSEPPPAPAPAPAPVAPQGVTVTKVEVGRAIGADKWVSEPTRSFAPADTLYVSVETSGTAPSVAIAAKWTYEDGQVVDESTQTLAPTGPAVTEFHVSKPDGWPAGAYRVEIQLDGRTAASETFTVGGTGS